MFECIYIQINEYFIFCVRSDKSTFVCPWDYFWVFFPNIGPWASNIVCLFLGIPVCSHWHSEKDACARKKVLQKLKS